mgnify:CR=1 FL=1
MSTAAKIIAAGIVLTAIGLLRKSSAAQTTCKRTIQQNRQVLLFGDSQAQSALGVAICRQLEMLEGYCQLQVSTHGGKSSYQSEIRRKLNSQITDHKFTDVILIFGVNDTANGRTWQQTRNNLNELAAIAGQNGARVFIVPPTTWNAYKGRSATLPGRQQNTVSLQAALFQDAAANRTLAPYSTNGYIVVGSQELPSFVRLWGRQGLDRQLSTDGLHYNTRLGRSAVAEHIARRMTTACN